MKLINNLAAVKALFWEADPRDETETVCCKINLVFGDEQSALDFFNEINTFENRRFRVRNPSWGVTNRIVELSTLNSIERANIIIEFLLLYYQLPPIVTVNYPDPEKMKSKGYLSINDKDYHNVKVSMDDTSLLSITLSAFVTTIHGISPVIEEANLPFTVNLHNIPEVESALISVQKNKHRLSVWMGNTAQAISTNQQRQYAADFKKASEALEKLESQQKLLINALRFATSSQKPDLEKRRKQISFKMFFASGHSNNDNPVEQPGLRRTNSFGSFTE